jgi:hypothetical protein
MDEIATTPELVFGLVGPLGTDLSSAAQVLKDALAQVSYNSEIHRLSHLMRDLSGNPWDQLTDGPRDSTIFAHMTAGNCLRQTLGRNDAMAMLGLMSIQELRQRQTEDSTKQLPIRSHPAFSQASRRSEDVAKDLWSCTNCSRCVCSSPQKAH